MLGTPLGLDPARLAALYDLPYVRIDDLARLGEAGAANGARSTCPSTVPSNRALHERLGAAAAAAVPGRALLSLSRRAAAAAPRA